MWCIALGLAMSKVLPMDISFSVSSVFFSIGFSILLAAPYNMYGQLGRWIKKTGDISYSVYLCHIPVILLCNYIFEDSALYNCTLLYFVFVMLVIYVMSFLSHKYIESI